MSKHFSGYVNIIGKPNVGKSTLLNAFIGEKMAIITSKPQTTRHRILGILSEDDFQIVFSDTPGLIHEPGYKMQRAMNDAAFSIFEDADVVLFVIDPYDPYDGTEKVISKIKATEVPKFLIINKVDLSDPDTLKEMMALWKERIDFDEVHCISALEKIGIDHLLNQIKARLPEGPVYFPKDQISDRSERFFISEIVREKILMLYKQEIPYSAEVVVTEFKESVKNDKPFVRIRAEIYVMRNTQKQILIGRQGASIKKLGIESRKDIEKFLEKRIHLELFVKVKEKWRDDDRFLKGFGYLQ
ncbi:MAG: GTPase Era [Saprospiraceae bacterium]|nr:GTPase Era [Bacteroidia bacterium]NNE16434.1 GTPase Era [Saprospiraceae bacterium]NNL91139.1 GTPase Era [Saprospiraceae bacterium]